MSEGVGGASSNRRWVRSLGDAVALVLQYGRWQNLAPSDSLQRTQSQDEMPPTPNNPFFSLNLVSTKMPLSSLAI